MQVYLVLSSLDGQDEIEGVFSTEAIAETYVDQLAQDDRYEGCTFMVLPEVVDQFIN